MYSRDLEIQAALEQIERLSMSRPVLLEPPPAVDPGLLPLTETQLKAVSKAMAPGADAEVLASDSFKGASRHSRCPCLASAECIAGFGELDISRKDMACMRDGVWLNDEVRAGQPACPVACPVVELSTLATRR